MMVVHDYIDQNGNLRAAHHGSRRYDHSVMLGVRDPGSPKYGSGDRHGPYPDCWGEVRKDPKISTDPMDDPPTVN